jgi:hypothetical protein
MNNNKSAHNAKEYISPSILRIELDYEISLTLDSNSQPNTDPTWNGTSYNMQQPINDPFKTNIG